MPNGSKRWSGISVADIESPWNPHGNSTLTQVAAEGDNQYLNNGWNSNFRSGSRALPEGT